MTFAEKILEFNEKLACKSLILPAGFKIVNPFIGEQKEMVKRIATAFYQKYYNDKNSRRLILGSSPARRGSAVIGIPFEDAKHIQSETGIFVDKFYINKASSSFLYDIMKAYGDCKTFYTDFYMNFVCPLGIVKINSNGNEVNCNYYDSRELQESLHDLIVNSIRCQIGFGIDTSVCYCIGSGENYRFLSKINEKYNFFDKVMPLEHPRFIMQYNSKDKEKFIEKYISSLSNYNK